MTRYLIERRGINGERARALASISLGSFARALNPETEELAEKRALWIDALSAVKVHGAWAAFAEELAKDRSETLQFLDWLADWYRDILVYRATDGAGELCNRDLLEKLRAQAAALTAQNALRLRARTLAASARIRRNVNRRFALENLLAKIREVSASS